MTIGVLSSTLFGDMFGTAAMRAAFGELGFLARCAEVEACWICRLSCVSSWRGE